MADYKGCCPPKFNQRYPYRDNPAGKLKPEKPSDHAYRSSFSRQLRKGTCFHTSYRSVHGSSMHLYTVATQVPGVKESIPFATAVVLRLGALVNASAIALRVWLRNRKSGRDGYTEENKVEDLRLAYGGIEVIHNISFEVFRNEILAI